MPQSRTRRPLPAVISLVVLVLFTAIVWWRVLQRHTSTKSSAQTTASHSASHGPAPTCVAKPLVLPKPRQVAVNVYNGSGKNGLAASTKLELQRRGFQVPLIGNAPKSFAGVAQLQAGPSGKSAAQLLQMYVPGAVFVASTRADATVDMVLGAKFGTIAPQNQVDAAVAAAGKKC